MGLLVMTNPQLGSFCFETTKGTSSCGTIFGLGSKTAMNVCKKRSGRVFVMRNEESEKRLVLEKELEFKPSFNEYLKAMDSVKTARETKPKLAYDKSTYSSKDDWKENVKLSKFDEEGSVTSKSRDANVKRVSRGETSNGRSLLYQRDNGVEPKLKESHFDKGANFRNASRDSSFRRSNTTSSIDTRGELVCDQNSSNMVMFGTKGKSNFEREKVGVRSWGRGAHGGSTPERNLVRVQKDSTDNEIEPKSGLINSSKSFRVKSGTKEMSSFKRERVAVRSWGRGTLGGSSSTPERNLVRVQKDSTDNEIEPKSRNLMKSRNLISSSKTFHVKSKTKEMSSFGRERVGVRSWGRGTLGGSTPEKNLVRVQKDFTENEIEPRSGKLISSSKSSHVKSGGDSSWEVERAAFNTFEEDNDIMDKPRVSKMEMEDRIQNLARRLNGADINVPEWMFSKTMRSARIRFSDHSILRVIQLLGKLGNWRRVLQVIEWLQMRERYKSHRLRNIYTTALNVLGKARRPVEALNVFHAMQQQMSSYPDLVAYHCIAVTLGQAGHIKELFDVIDSMRSPPKKKFKTGVLEKWDPRLEPDIVIYNAVLNACVRRKQFEGAFWVLQQFKQQGQKPSATTYGLVMEVMFACGKYSLVHEFFRKVQKSLIPNALQYKVIVNTLWREGKIDEAVSVVQDMERLGIVGSAALYYDLARCLCSVGRCQEALIQMEKICKVANKPLVVTYTGLIQACLDSGNIQDAADIFIQMKDFCSPNLVTCNIMLKAYLEHGWFEEAKKLFQKMSEDSDHISNESDKRDLVLPDIYTFNTMLEAFTAEKRWDEVDLVYRRMLHHGYFFNAKRHLRMILDASRAGKVELLETTWNHLGQTDRIPPPPLIKERFCIKLENKDYASALSCITCHPESDWPEFSETAWLNLFKNNSWRFGEDTLVQLLHEASIHTRRSLPNSVLLNLISSCKVFLRTRIVPAMNLRDTLSTVLSESALK